MISMIEEQRRDERRQFQWFYWCLQTRWGHYICRNSIAVARPFYDSETIVQNWDRNKLRPSDESFDKDIKHRRRGWWNGNRNRRDATCDGQVRRAFVFSGRQDENITNRNAGFCSWQTNFAGGGDDVCDPVGTWLYICTCTTRSQCEYRGDGKVGSWIGSQ